MKTLQVVLLGYIQHLESVEVRFTHSDLPLAFAQVIVQLPKDEAGAYLDGDALTQAIEGRAPPREWFELQDAKLAGTAQGVAMLPESLRAVAPILPLADPLLWYEDGRLDAPQIVAGQWVRPVVRVDLRTEENLPQLKTLLQKRLADVRYTHETGGVDVGGALVKTDRESQATITGAYARALSDTAVTVAWKADNGFVTLDAAAILLFGGAVFDHVQACFAREAALSAAIDAAATVADLMAVDIEAGWPAVGGA